MNKKSIIIIILLLLKSIISLAQKGDDCFNIANWDIQPKQDSNTMKNINKRIQQFYDEFINCKAPDFKVVTIDGDTIELNKLKGKIVVINFWFIECGGCIAEIPDFNKLVEEYKNKDIVFISMARNNKAELTKDFIPKHALNTIIIPDCIQIAIKYSLITWPSTYILNKKGRLEKAFVGTGKNDINDKTDFYGRMKNIIDGLL